MLCYKDLQDSTLYKYEFKKLYKIYELFKQIDKFNIYNTNTPTNTNTNTNTNTTKTLIHQYTMYLWLLENSIKDYDHITNETTDTYYKLIDSYKHINSNIDKDNNSNIDNDNDTTTNNTQETLSNVENIIYIENNIDLYNQIIYLLNLNNSTIDNFFICKSYYLFSLFTDIYKYIKQINILSNSIMY